MATKRATQKRGTGSRGRRGGNSSSSRISAATLLEKPLENMDLRKFNGGGYKKVVRNIYKSPISLYLVGGVAAYFIGRFSWRYYQDHPEVSEFIKDNFDTVETRLREFRSGGEEVARH